MLSADFDGRISRPVGLCQTQMSDKPHTSVCTSSGGTKRYRSETEEAQEQRETDGSVLASGELATGRPSTKRIKLVGCMTARYQCTPRRPLVPTAGTGLRGNNGDHSTSGAFQTDSNHAMSGGCCIQNAAAAHSTLTMNNHATLMDYTSQSGSTLPTDRPLVPTHPPTTLWLPTADRREEEQGSVQASNNGTPDELVCPQVEVVTPDELVFPLKQLLMSRSDQNCS